MTEELYMRTVRVVAETGACSLAILVGRLGVTFGQAYQLIDRLEHERIVGPQERGDQTLH